MRRRGTAQLLSIAGLCVVAAGCTSRGERAVLPHSDDARTVVNRLQDRIQLAFATNRSARPPMPPGMPTPPMKPPLLTSDVQTFQRDGEGLTPIFARGPIGTQRPAELHLPTRADQPVKLTDKATGMTITFRLDGAAGSAAEESNGFVVYRGAWAGGDLVQRPTVEGTEDYLWLAAPPAKPEVTYHVTLDEQVSGLRLVSNVLEFVDRDNDPRLRITPPYLLGADGKRTEATISAEGCRIDSNPAAPWGRKPIDPGARECPVKMQWADGGVAYPAMVDPVWSTTGSMAHDRYQHQAVLLDSGLVLVAGGSGNGGATAEIYDPATGSWSTTGSMNSARTDFAMTTLIPGSILATGGYSNGYLNTCEIYSTYSGTWSYTSPLNTARDWHTATPESDGGVLVTGGYDSNGAALSSAEELIVGHWYSAGISMTYARAQHQALTLGGGKILAIGGYGSSGATSYCEIYDPVRRVWTTTGSLNQARWNFGAVVLSDGVRVIVAGGDINGQTATTEEYNGATWSFTSSMEVPRSVPSLTLLANDQYVIAGGYYRENGGPQATSEIATGGSAWAYYGGLLGFPRYYHTGTKIGNNSILLAGGWNNAYSTNTAEVLAVPTSTCSSPGDCTTGYCVDGYCCNSACNGGSCERCDVAGSLGTCTVFSQGASGNPACDPGYVCDGVNASCPTSCTSDAQCAMGNYCSSNHCVAKAGPGGACSLTDGCQAGVCVGGICCNSACADGCDSCNQTGKTGTCSPIPAGQVGSGSCGLYLCNGGNSTCPSTCQRDADCASDAYCAPGGACTLREAAGTACIAPNQCQSGFCADGLCCDTACSGACDACSRASGAAVDGTCAAIAAGQPGSPSCAPYVCDGTNASCPAKCATDTDCAPGNYCGSGTCQPKKKDGVGCAFWNECGSGWCVDGVCCNTSCSGDCATCNPPGSPGTCSPAIAGDPGRNSCQPYVCDGAQSSCPTSCTSNAQCVMGDACVNGVCMPSLTLGQTCSTSLECQSGFCADGVCCNASCSGGCDVCTATLGATMDGMCTVIGQGKAGASPSCAPYVCDGQSGACPSACHSDADCVAGDYCGGNQCLPRAKAGAACTTADGCGSGFCADGVCCDSACTGQCEACNLPSSPGVCSAVSGPPASGRPACATDGTSCGGICDGTNRLACAYPTTTCGPPSCQDGVAYPSPQCNGAGACKPGAKTVCSPYLCGGTACLSQCATDADCVQGSYCKQGQCSAVLPLGSACSANDNCTSGICAQGVCCQSSCNGACETCGDSAHPGTCEELSAGTAPASGACAPYLCDGMHPSCPTTCASNADCATGAGCLHGACVPLKPLGAACSSAGECGQGFCVDGVCCDSACTGSCQSCALPGHPGTCGFVTGTPATGRPACQGTGFCGGVCDGTQAACSYPKAGAMCSPGFCDNATETSASTCDGMGACVAGQQTPCPLGCSGAQCAPDSIVAKQSSCASAPVSALAFVLAMLLLARRKRRA